MCLVRRWPRYETTQGVPANMFMRVGLAVGLGLFSGTLQAETPPPVSTVDARALAESMHVAEQSRIGLVAGLDMSVQQGKITQQKADCIKSADLSFTTDLYATSIQATLSPAEIKDAIKFFSSPAGQGYIEYSRSLEFKQRGVPDPKPKELNDKETRATLAFMETSAGKKILDQQVLQSADLKSALMRGMFDVVRRCNGQ